MAAPSPPQPDAPAKPLTLRDLRAFAKQGRKFPVLTCYDATTARWLVRGGVRTLLVGDTAAQMVLGHDSTLPAKMGLMLELTAAVRRGAPGAVVIADMPFGSYQCGPDEAVRHAVAFVADAGADLVKLELEAADAELVARLTRAGVPVMAHLGSRPQRVRIQGGYRAAGKTPREADALVESATVMLRAGAAALLVEAVPDAVARRIVDAAVAPDTGDPVPVIGCGAGPACHGHVVVWHDLAGLSDWQPPFAKPIADLGEQVRQTAAAWAELVESGRYLREGGPYRPDPQAR